MLDIISSVCLFESLYHIFSFFVVCNLKSVPGLFFGPFNLIGLAMAYFSITGKKIHRAKKHNVEISYSECHGHFLTKYDDI